MSFESTSCAPMTAPTAPPLVAVPDGLQETLDRLRRAREALEAATNEWHAAGEAAQASLRDCRSSVSCKDQSVPPTALRLMQSLYWDFPEIGSVCIADAFGLDGAYQVYGLVAPSEA